MNESIFEHDVMLFRPSRKSKDETFWALLKIAILKWPHGAQCEWALIFYFLSHP